MKAIPFREGNLAYSSEGKGYPVVLLHGFCEDHRVWDEWKQDLLEEGCQVICVDLPGFGQSSVIHQLSIADMAEGVHELVSALELPPFIMVGHSMGGYVALAFSRLFPGRLQGLGLFHSHPYADSEEKKALRQRSIDFIQRQGHILFVKQLIPSLFAAGFARSNTFLMEKLVYRASRFDSDGIIAAQQAMRDRPDESQHLSQLAIPVLFIIGQKDSSISPEQNQAQVQLPQLASIHLLEKAAHMGMFEAKKPTQRFLRQFVRFCEQQALSNGL